jgi:hypothetical protein
MGLAMMTMSVAAMSSTFGARTAATHAALTMGGVVLVEIRPFTPLTCRPPVEMKDCGTDAGDSQAIFAIINTSQTRIPNSMDRLTNAHLDHRPSTHTAFAYD